MPVKETVGTLISITVLIINFIFFKFYYELFCWTFYFLLPGVADEINQSGQGFGFVMLIFFSIVLINISTSVIVYNLISKGKWKILTYYISVLLLIMSLGAYVTYQEYVLDEILDGYTSFKINGNNDSITLHSSSSLQGFSDARDLFKKIKAMTNKDMKKYILKSSSLTIEKNCETKINKISMIRINPYHPNLKFETTNALFFETPKQGRLSIKLEKPGENFLTISSEEFDKALRLFHERILYISVDWHKHEFDTEKFLPQYKELCKTITNK